MTLPAKPFTAQDVPFASTGDDERRFVRVADGHYQLTAPDVLNTELEIDHVRRERHQLHGELTVRTGLAGTRTVYGVLFGAASVNLSSLRERDTIARALAGSTRTEAHTWRPVVDELCIRVAAAEKTGDPAVVVRDHPRRGPERFRRVLGFTLPEKLPAMLFGDGDTLKTMTADAIGLALARSGVHVGIVDAELSIDEHAERIRQQSGGNVPRNLVYLACSRPLMHERDRVAEMIREHGLEYLVLDSVGFLCHDKPEFAESALAYNSTLRGFGIGSLSIAHTNRSDQGDQKPFGSAFWFNSCRALWYAKRAESGDASVVDVGFYPRKFNLGQRPGAHALRFTFDATGTTVAPVEAASVEGLATALPIKERVRAVLKAGARTLPEIGAELPDVDTEALSRTVRRYTGDKAKFQLFAKLPDGRFGLVNRGTL